MSAEFRSLGSPNLSHKRPTPLKEFLFGAAYYPEHWSEAERAADPPLMAKAGINVVRMAEFAWDILEPEEGRFEFELFDETIERLGAKGIRSILCTPTAAPPRWLTKRHPEVLRVDENGVRLEHGSRQHCCLASPLFRSYSRRIARAMARHFRPNPHVIGWQTDNEFYCHFSECHCENCRQEFVDYLRARFANDIGALNRAWGTAFWAQTYASFDDVPTPRQGKPTFLNPAHRLEYHLFLSHVAARFQHQQVEILRRGNPRWFIMHNGLFSNIDYRGEFSRDLDFLGYDCYPFFTSDPEERPWAQSWGLNVARAWAGNFIVPEQQSGPGGQQTYFHDNPEPGELRRMTYVSVARGADSLLYFRWRTCRFGAEEYWCGILDHDNVPRRRYEEVARTGAELEKVGPEILGTWVHADCAVAAADMRMTQAHQALHLGLPSGDHIARSLHRALLSRGYAAGCVHPSDDLSDLRLYIIPHWEVFDPAWVPGLENWVKAGGTLVIGARTATRDLNNNVIADTPPGCLRALAGAAVDEYGRQNAPGKRPLTLQFPEASVQSELWYEVLKLESDAKPLAIWKGRHLGGKPAVSIRSLGRGHVVYAGTYMTDGVMSVLLPDLIKRARLEPLWPDAPARVEVVLRRNEKVQVWFFINHNEHAVTLASTPKGRDLLTGRPTGGPIEIGAGDVAVIKV